MKAALLLAALLAVPLAASPAYAQANAQVVPTDKGTLDIGFALEPDDVSAGEPARMKIDFLNPSTGDVQVHIDYQINVEPSGGGDPAMTIPLTHTSSGSVSIPIEFASDEPHTVEIGVKGILFQPIALETASLGLAIGGEGEGAAEEETPGGEEGGGCLIATAAYGTETAAQVQALREIRDWMVAETPAGASFMGSFNAVYYAFSPAVADLERQSPAFKEAVRAAIAPMLAALSILGAAEAGSDAEAVSYGLAVVALNAALYAGVPAASVVAARRLALKARHS